MAIPVEKRDLTDGWVLTCRGADGSDLTLTDLSIKRENLTCQGECYQIRSPSLAAIA